MFWHPGSKRGRQEHDYKDVALCLADNRRPSYSAGLPGDRERSAYQREERAVLRARATAYAMVPQRRGKGGGVGLTKWVVGRVAHPGYALKLKEEGGYLAEGTVFVAEATVTGLALVDLLSVLGE